MTTTEALMRLRADERLGEHQQMSDALVRHLDMLADDGLVVRETMRVGDVPFRAWRRAQGAVL